MEYDIVVLDSLIVTKTTTTEQGAGTSVKTEKLLSPSGNDQTIRIAVILMWSIARN